MLCVLELFEQWTYGLLPLTHGGAIHQAILHHGNAMDIRTPVVLFLTLFLGGVTWAGEVRLKSGTVTTSDESTAKFFAALQASAADALHGVATLARYPTNDERKALEGAGFTLLSPLQDASYRVRVDKKRLDITAIRSSPLKPLLAELTAANRLEPGLAAGRYERFSVAIPREGQANYVLNKDGSVNVTVRTYPSVADDLARKVLAAHAPTRLEKQGRDSWIVTIDRNALKRLAGEDIVQWIDNGPPFFMRENNKTRHHTNVDAVQNFMNGAIPPKGLGGRNIQVGIFELGLDRTHPDFSGRVLHDSAFGPDTHATYIAGIVGSSGQMSATSNSCGSGCAFQWRGMAPLAKLIDINRDVPFGPNGASAEVNLRYIDTFGMDLSNHSYGVNHEGVYDNSTHDRDQVIRGDAVFGNRRVPPRLHVYSAGNHASYFGITKQMKNGLVVGSWWVRGMEQAPFIDPDSSRGPAQDGRIKPDIVAPGAFVRSTWCCSNPPELYHTTGGSSAAAAATSGAIALVLEKYAKTFAVNLDTHPPRPSTLRGLMIHTARDRSLASEDSDTPTPTPTPGPDFTIGWGLIDAKAAVSAVARGRIIEGTVAQTCDVVTYTFKMPKGVSGPVRLTLAWDDVAADTDLPDSAPKLVNDLDLVVIDPAGERHWPWQLDQTFFDSSGKQVADGTCSQPLRVRRQFLPGANPTTSMPAAVRGPDHLNNVEVVDINGPLRPGTWTIQVLAFNVPQGPQSYSLIGGRRLTRK